MKTYSFKFIRNFFVLTHKKRPNKGRMIYNLQQMQCLFLQNVLH